MGNESKRGFASMDPARQREIASRGGAGVKKEDRSFSRDNELAKTAGKKGGLSVSPKKRSFATDPKLASRAGRLGGLVGGKVKSKPRAAP